MTNITRQRQKSLKKRKAEIINKAKPCSLEKQKIMKQTILIAGGTGNLGGRIIRDLIKRGAEVRAIVRQETDSEKQRN